MKLSTIPIRSQVIDATGFLTKEWIQWLRELVDFVRSRQNQTLNLYIRTDGKDSNDGLTDKTRGAFLTLQKAIDVYHSIDTKGYDVVINVADGAYTEGILLTNRLGGGSLTIQGNTTTPSNCTITVDDGNCIEIAGHPAWSQVTIQGFKLATTTSGSGIVVSGGSNILYGAMDFGSVIDYHVSALEGGLIAPNAAYDITGGAKAHWHSDHAEIGDPGASLTVTLTGTPDFSVAFAEAIALGLIDPQDYFTFSGSATGVRYLADANSVINTAGSGASYLPGDSVGSTSNGGQYI